MSIFHPVLLSKMAISQQKQIKTKQSITAKGVYCNFFLYSFQPLQIIIQCLEVGFAPTLGKMVGVVSARQALAGLGIVLNVTAGVGDETETVAESIKSIVTDGGVHQVFAKSESTVVDAHLM